MSIEQELRVEIERLKQERFHLAAAHEHLSLDLAESEAKVAELLEGGESGMTRWEVGFRNIVTNVVGARVPFDIPEIVDAVRELAQKLAESERARAELQGQLEEARRIVWNESYLPKIDDEGGCEGCATGWCQSAVDAVCAVRNQIIARLDAARSQGGQ
jgi:hypothetical protein